VVEGLIKFHLKGCEVNANGHAGAGWHAPLPAATVSFLAGWKQEGGKGVVSVKQLIIISLPVRSQVTSKLVPASIDSSFSSASIIGEPNYSFI